MAKLEIEKRHLLNGGMPGAGPLLFRPGTSRGLLTAQLVQLWSNKVPSNYAINSDNKKRRAFVAPLFIAGYGERWAARVAQRDGYE
jgi:hypothetical protein